LLSYYLQDCGASLVMATRNQTDILNDVIKDTKLATLILGDDNHTEEECETVNSLKESRLQFDSFFLNYVKPINFYSDKDAMILYTSGTTGQPKGVLLSHQNIDSQVRMLIETWKWSSKDVIVNALPLHHTHGVVNALLCPLYVGARCIMLPKYDAKEIWSKFLGNDMSSEERPTIFMGVPTMYSKLLDSYETNYGNNLRMMEYVKAICSSRMRVMISGSAALPEPVFHKWKNATGHDIVERYGMVCICLVSNISF